MSDSSSVRLFTIHRFERQTGLTFSALSGRLLKKVDWRDDMRVGVVAEPTGDWTAALRGLPKRLEICHVATTPAEQVEARARSATANTRETIVWEVLRLPSQPNPALCRFEVLLGGFNVTGLNLGEFFNWARAAVSPGGHLTLAVELFRGDAKLQDKYTRYRRFRARFVDRVPDLADHRFPTRDALIGELQGAGFDQVLMFGLQKPGRMKLSEYVVVTAR